MLHFFCALPGTLLGFFLFSNSTVQVTVQHELLIDECDDQRDHEDDQSNGGTIAIVAGSTTFTHHVGGHGGHTSGGRHILAPHDIDQIEKLLAEKQPKENLAFVGDGINDAPVLSRADVGIAMGALGSDAAIEAADVVLMDDDPAKIALAMRIARRTLRIVYQNIVFALAIKFACLVLGAIGMASMWTAIFADVGVMVLAVLNATRALYTKDLAKKNEQ